MPRVKGISDDNVRLFFQDTMHECREETRLIRKVWDVLLQQYLCEKDFSKKKEWQFKVYTPVGKPIIKKAVRLIKKNILTQGDYFDFDSPSKNEERIKRCNLTKRALKVHFDAAKFVDTFSDCLESGFTFGLMVCKMWVGTRCPHFEYDITEDGGELSYPERLGLFTRAVNPFNFWFTLDKTICIEDEWMTLPELRKIVDETEDENGEPVYDKKILKKLENEDYGNIKSVKEDDQRRLRELGIDKQHNPYRKEVKLSHFWGPLITKDNKMVHDKVHFVMANDKHLIMKPRENPYWHGKPPYVWGSPLKVLFRHVGKGLTEDVRHIEDAIVDFVNMQLDNLLWQQMGIRVTDQTAFDDLGRGQLRELYPGKLITKRSNFAGNAFEYHELGADPTRAMPILSELKQLHEGDHGVTEYLSAMTPQVRSSATEYQGKRQEAMGDFHAIAMDIERTFLTECVDMGRDLMLQYLADFDNDPSISTIFEEEGVLLDELEDAERRALIVTDVDFVGKGISIFFEREEKLNKLGSYVKMLNALPEQAQWYPVWPKILERFNDAFAFDKRNELVRTEEEVRQMQAQNAQQQQQAFQQQLQAGMMQLQAKHGMDMEKERGKHQLELAKMQTEADQKEKDRMVKVFEIMNDDRKEQFRSNK